MDSAETTIELMMLPPKWYYVARQTHGCIKDEERQMSVNRVILGLAVVRVDIVDEVDEELERIKGNGTTHMA